MYYDPSVSFSRRGMMLLLISLSRIYMLAIFTGNGKGKTTSALGAALRALGRGQRVLMVQFIKGPWKSGEDTSTKLLSEEVVTKAVGKGGMVFKKMGLGFVGILGDSLPIEEHKKAAEKALMYLNEQAESGSWDVIICDEINVATSLGLISESAALDLAKKIPEEKILIFTGRGAPASFIEAADLATEMKELKHPYQKGQMGKINIEF